MLYSQHYIFPSFREEWILIGSHTSAVQVTQRVSSFTIILVGNQSCSSWMRTLPLWPNTCDPHILESGWFEKALPRVTSANEIIKASHTSCTQCVSRNVCFCNQALLIGWPYTPSLYLVQSGFTFSEDGQQATYAATLFWVLLSNLNTPLPSLRRACSCSPAEQLTCSMQLNTTCFHVSHWFHHHLPYMNQ